MKSQRFLIFFVLLMTSCTFNERIFENQISANSNQTPVNQNTNVQKPANKPVKKEIDYYAHIKAEHREVLREWLKTKTYLRPAVEEIDNSIFLEKYKEYFEENLKFLRETVGAGGYQYYAVGDMNHDRKVDFAVLLVDSRNPGNDDEPDEFALAIFNAPFKKGQAPNILVEGLYGITNSYIVFDKMIKKYLYLGKFESDVLCATFYPKGKTYYFKDCFDQ